MKRLFSAIIILLTVNIFVLSGAVANAASPNISRSYSSNTSLHVGSLVSLSSGSTSEVELSNSSNAARLVGVVVQSGQSLLAVNPNSGNVQVATDGSVNALVCTVNGNISSGQQVAISPFNGIGMKANPGDRVVGTATTSFDNSTAGSVNEQVTDSHGSVHTITVGYVRVAISIGNASSANFSVKGLQTFIESLTGHPISVFRLILAMIIAFVAIVAIIILIYASIYGSIVSIGRNPLAKYAVFRTLTSVIAMVVVIAIIASAAAYALLY